MEFHQSVPVWKKNEEINFSKDSSNFPGHFKMIPKDHVHSPPERAVSFAFTVA